MTALFPSVPPERVAALCAIRDRHPGLSGKHQCARLLEALQTMGHCSTFEASRYLDLYDPRARKMDLLKAGHRVLMVWRHVRTECGATHRVGVYSLLKGRAE